MLDQHTHTHVERSTPKTPDELAYAKWLREHLEAKERERAWAEAVGMVATLAFGGFLLASVALYWSLRGWSLPF